MTEIEMWERLTELTNSSMRSRDFCHAAAAIFDQRWEETAYPGLSAVAMILRRAARHIPDDYLMDAAREELARREGVAA